MNKQIETYLAGIGQQIAGRAVEMVDEYVVLAVKSVEDYERQNPTRQIPRVGVLDSEYCEVVKKIIRGEVVDADMAQMRIAEGQITKAIKEREDDVD